MAKLKVLPISSSASMKRLSTLSSSYGGGLAMTVMRLELDEALLKRPRPQERSRLVNVWLENAELAADNKGRGAMADGIRDE